MAFIGNDEIKRFDGNRGIVGDIQRLLGFWRDGIKRAFFVFLSELRLTGQPEFAEENEERSLYAVAPEAKKPLDVAYNAAIPIEAFDFIVTDECHRSIYNLWRQVLEYFDAFLVGLTATPSKQTIGKLPVSRPCREKSISSCH